ACLDGWMGVSPRCAIVSMVDLVCQGGKDALTSQTNHEGAGDRGEGGVWARPVGRAWLKLGLVVGWPSRVAVQPVVRSRSSGWWPVGWPAGVGWFGASAW